MTPEAEALASETADIVQSREDGTVVCWTFFPKRLRKFADRLRPRVDDAMVERGARAVCVSDGLDPDVVVGMDSNGGQVFQWQIHAVDVDIALTAALEGESNG